MNSGRPDLAAADENSREFCYRFSKIALITQDLNFCQSCMTRLSEIFLAGQFDVSTSGEVHGDHLAVVQWLGDSGCGQKISLGDRAERRLSVTHVDFDVLPATIAGTAFIQVPDANAGDSF